MMDPMLNYFKYFLDSGEMTSTFYCLLVIIFPKQDRA